MSAIPWALTDRDAKNIYNKMCNWYNAPNNLPNHVNDSGVFFGFANFTRDKLWYCIEYLKNRYSLGWFTDNFNDRENALNQIAAELYDIFLGTVDESGIYKFLQWVYNFAKTDDFAVKYFTGGGYGIIDSIVNSVKTNIAEPTSNAVDAVEYGLKVPSLKSILPDNSTMVKLGLIVAGCVITYKLFNK